MEARLAGAGHPLAGFLVQRMARGGHEVIFGLSSDERFGPVLMFGLGGKYVEVFHDVRFGVPPLGSAEALELVRGIRGIRLLEACAATGRPISTCSPGCSAGWPRSPERYPAIVEIDVNPFLAGARESSLALDARVRVAAP